MDYMEFLKSKIDIAAETGFDISLDDINPVLLPHQKDAIKWAIKGGKRALFEAFGLGKTGQQLEICRIITEREGGKALIVLPLGVKQEFTNDAVNLLGWSEPPHYVRTMEEAERDPSSILMTNYERVRDGDIDPKHFTVTTLDEAAVLRSFGSKTYQTFLDKFKGVPYKFVCTATPSPNRFKELIHYAGYLEIMDTGQALTRFFQRDSTKANNLTLYPHKETEFWLWMSSWALFITKPSDLNYSDEGYVMPPLDIRYHEIPVNHLTAGFERDGQGKMFREAAAGLVDAAKEKRDSVEARVSKIMEIVKKTMEADNEKNTEGIKQAILREKQRERENSLLGILSQQQRQDRPGKTTSLHEGISQNIPAKEVNSRTEGRKESQTSGEICHRSRVQGERKGKCFKISQQKQRQKTDYQLRTTFGITKKQYDQMLEAQNGKCAICGTSELAKTKSRLYVDHDHVTGKIRGILCHHCNFGIGHFKDNPEILQKAIDYLIKSSSGAILTTNNEQ